VFTALTLLESATKKQNMKFTTIAILLINAYLINAYDATAFAFSPTISNARSITYTKSTTGTATHLFYFISRMKQQFLLLGSTISSQPL
jgi:uncharacterized membrane protein YdfJ with MMPL/SSD domain